MKNRFLLLGILTLIVAGCTDQSRLLQLESDNRRLAARVAELETAVARYKELDTSVFSEIPLPKEGPAIAGTVTALQAFIAKFPQSELVGEAHRRLTQAQEIQKRKEEKKAAIEKDKGLFRSLADVKSDQSRYVDKLMRVNAVVSLSPNFNYGSRNNQHSYISFRIQDGTADAYVYVANEWEGTEELLQLVQNNSPRRMNIRYKIKSERYQGASEIHADLLGYGPVENP